MSDKNEKPTTNADAQTGSTNGVQNQPDAASTPKHETDAEYTAEGEQKAVSEQTEAKKKQLAKTDTNSTSQTSDSSHEGSNKQVAQSDDSSTDAAAGLTQDVTAEAQAAHHNMQIIEDDEDDLGSTTPMEAKDVGNTTNDLREEAIKAMARKAEKDRLAREQAAADVERSIFEEEMLLRLDVIETNHPITLEVNGDLIVGRADNVTDYTPEIDLTAHGAYRLGLSRRHALIRRQDEGILVKDLSSRNGTYVNGEKVRAGDTHVLRDGDELRFGNLALRVNFERKP